MVSIAMTGLAKGTKSELNSTVPSDKELCPGFSYSAASEGNHMASECYNILHGHI